MTQRHVYPTTLAAIALLLMSAANAQTASQTDTKSRRPGRPPQLCANNVCSSATQSSSVSAAGRAVKWHPGHYGLSMSRFTPKGVAQTHADWAAILSADSRFVGVNGFYDWYHLEPTAQGGYDFSSIDNDIAWLKANFPGKKLLIEVWTRNFCGQTALPTVPQDTNYGCTKIPDYIISGAYTGSSGTPGATWNSNGVCKRWMPPWPRATTATRRSRPSSTTNSPRPDLLPTRRRLVGPTLRFRAPGGHCTRAWRATGLPPTSRAWRTSQGIPVVARTSPCSPTCRGSRSA
jgi:hypothetical protein